MTVAKLMTAGELAETMIALIGAGVLVAVRYECGVGFLPADDVPEGAVVLTDDEVREHFARIGEHIFPMWN